MADRILTALHALAVPYEVIEIDPAFSDTAPFCERYGFPLEQTCNTIIVTGKVEPRIYAACVIAGTTRLDVNGRVRRLLGVQRASFAPAEAMRALTGMEVGGVTPIGLPTGIPLYVDAPLAAHDWVILGAGRRDAKLKLAPRVFTALGAELVDGLGRR